VTGSDALAGIKVASLGPVTSATAREAGLTVDVEAEPHTIEGLVDAIVRTRASR
jgi:uroporphyrinogen III methyltransferase/synthase